MSGADATSLFPAGWPGYRTTPLRLASGLGTRAIFLGADDAPPVLFLHGWGSSPYFFHRTMPAVVAAGYRAVAIDLKGHGLADKPDAEEEYTLDGMLSFVHDAMDALAFHQRVAIVGHSMGGALAVHVATTWPERVSRIALFSPAGFGAVPLQRLGTALSPGILNPMLPAIVRPWTIAVALRFMRGGGAVPRADLAEYEALLTIPGFIVAMRHLLHRFRWVPFTEEELQRLSVPVLAMMAGADRVVRRASAGTLGERRGSRAVVVQGAGHVVQLDAAEAVNQALVEFLTQDER